MMRLAKNTFVVQQQYAVRRCLIRLLSSSTPNPSGYDPYGEWAQHKYSDPDHYNYHLYDPSRRWENRNFWQRGFTVGIDGPRGSGKTALIVELCRRLQREFPRGDRVGVLTNDVFTEEDSEFSIRNTTLPSSGQSCAMEKGGSPHAIIGDNANANLLELEELTSLLMERQQRYYQSTVPPLLLCESGGAQGIADLKVCVMDGAGGGNVGHSLTTADLLVVHKMDLVEAMGSDLAELERDAACMREQAPTIFASAKSGIGMNEVETFILEQYENALALAANKAMTS